MGLVGVVRPAKAFSLSGVSVSGSRLNETSCTAAGRRGWRAARLSVIIGQIVPQVVKRNDATQVRPRRSADEKGLPSWSVNEKRAAG